MDEYTRRKPTPWPVELLSERGIVFDCWLNDVEVQTKEHRPRTYLRFRLEASMPDPDVIGFGSISGNLVLAFKGGHGNADDAISKRWKLKMILAEHAEGNEGGDD